MNICFYNVQLSVGRKCFNIMSLEKINIIRYENGEIKEFRDQVVEEKPLTIFINDYEIATLLCTPKDLKSLIIGFLASEGLIEDIKNISNIKFDYQNTVAKVDINKKVRLNLLGKRTLTSGCGGGITFTSIKDCAESKTIYSSIRVKPDTILNLMQELHSSSAMFKKTGGTHSAALAQKNQLVITAEDIGRHNALDKIIGKSLIEDLSFEDKIILTSGRLSSEMVLKVLKQGIPVLVSRSAPTRMAVEMAAEKELTLIGFTRGKRMNIYTKSQRIKFEN